MKFLNMPVWQKYLLAFVISFTLCFLSVNIASAEGTKVAKTEVKSKIGVVNMDIIMQKSVVAKNIRTQIDKKRSEYQSKIKKREKELLSFQKGVLKEQDNLKEEELIAKKKLFKQKVLTAQKDAQAEMRKVDVAVEKALKQLRSKAASIVGDIAKKRGFDIVLSHQQVVLATRSLDITDEVLVRLNKELKAIKINWK